MPTIHTEDHPAGLALVPLAPGASAIPVLKGLLHAAMGGSVGGHYDDMRRALANEADSNADLCAEAEIARDEWRALALDLAARFGVAPGETAHGPANIRAALGLLVPVSMVGPAMGDHGDAVADLDGADTGIDCLPTTEAIPADDASPVGALAEEVFPHLTQALELAHELACARGWSEDCPETAGMPIPQMIALLLALIYHIAKSPPVQTVAKAGAAVLQSDDEPAAEVAEPPEELPPAAEVIPAVDAAAEIPAEPAAVADSDPADTEEVTPAPSVSAPELPERLIETSAEPEALTGDHEETALYKAIGAPTDLPDDWRDLAPRALGAAIREIPGSALFAIADRLEIDLANVGEDTELILVEALLEDRSDPLIVARDAIASAPELSLAAEVVGALAASDRADLVWLLDLQAEEGTRGDRKALLIWARAQIDARAEAAALAAKKPGLMRRIFGGAV